MDKIKSHKEIFSILFVTVFVTMLGLGVISPLMPIFAKSLGISGLWLGIIFSAFSLSRAIFMPIIGRESDKKGRKRFITLGLFIYFIVSLLYIFAKNVYLLTFVRLIHGLGSAMVLPIAMAFVGDISQKGREGIYMGTFNISLFAGMGAGPFLGGIIYDSLGMNYVFYTLAVLTFIAFLISLFFLPENEKLSDISHKIREISYKELLKNKLIKGILIFRLVVSLGRGGLMAFLPIFAVKIGIVPYQIGLIVSANIFTTAVFQRFFGKLSDVRDEIILIIIGSFISVVPLFFIPFTWNFLSLFLVIILEGFGSAVSIPAAMALGTKIGKEVGMGKIMSLINSSMSLGMIAAPLISGVVMDFLGINFVFYVAFIISLSGILLFWFLVKDLRKLYNS